MDLEKKYFWHTQDESFYNQQRIIRAEQFLSNLEFNKEEIEGVKLCHIEAINLSQVSLIKVDGFYYLFCRVQDINELYFYAFPNEIISCEFSDRSYSEYLISFMCEYKADGDVYDISATFNEREKELEFNPHFTYTGGDDRLSKILENLNK